MTTDYIFKPSSKRQEQFLNSKTFLTVFGGAAMSGKAQPLHSKVLTPTGWTTMGEIKVGDVVKTPENKDVVVLNVYDHKDKNIYKIITESGREVLACDEHLWSVLIRKPKYKMFENTCDTNAIISHIEKGHRVSLPLPEPLGNKEDYNLPLDPYVLGVFIAEGGLTTGQSIFTNTDSEMIDRISDWADRQGMKLHPSKDNTTFRVVNKELTVITDAKGRFTKTNPISNILFDLGLSGKDSYNKFIPKDYLHKASINQRFELLKGLMDSDGSISESGTCEYSTSSKQLQEDITYLVRSLGGVARVTSRYPTYTHNGEKRKGALSYRVYIRFQDTSKIFFLSRKLKRVKERTTQILDQIVSVEYIGKQDARCIYIDDPKHLYITDDFIITHNTYQGLMRFLWYVDDPLFSGYVVRKNATDFKKGGGAFEEAIRMFKLYDKRMTYTKQPMQITFSSGATINFIGLDGEAGMDAIQGIQITCAMVDEATHLSEEQIMWLITRLRATSEDIEPCLWLTCNPDPDSFLCEWLSNYYLYPLGSVVDGKLVEGRPIPERNGDTRYYLRIGNKMVWSSSYQELVDQYSKDFEVDEDGNTTCIPQSFSFIGATCLDNPLMLKKNPNYVSQLRSSPRIKMERLLMGNWYAREEGIGYFKRHWVEPLVKDFDYSQVKQWVRAFDVAYTVPSEENPTPDYTASVLMARTYDDDIVIVSAERERKRAGEVEAYVCSVVKKDQEYCQGNYRVFLPEDPSAGKLVRIYWAKLGLNHGITFRFMKMTSQNGKVGCFQPFSGSAENGIIKCVEDKSWNNEYFLELEGFDGKRSTGTKKDDWVDATSLAYNVISTSKELPTINPKLLKTR